jgi:hypothetical protein
MTYETAVLGKFAAIRGYLIMANGPATARGNKLLYHSGGIRRLFFLTLAFTGQFEAARVLHVKFNLRYIGP